MHASIGLCEATFRPSINVCRDCSRATLSAPCEGVHIVEATKQVYRAIPPWRESAFLFRPSGLCWRPLSGAGRCADTLWLRPADRRPRRGSAPVEPVKRRNQRTQSGGFAGSIIRFSLIVCSTVCRLSIGCTGPISSPTANIGVLPLSAASRGEFP